MISTENIEYSPDRFISNLRAELNNEKQRNKDMENQLRVQHQ
jgi:hypothetical protein